MRRAARVTVLASLLVVGLRIGLLSGTTPEPPPDPLASAASRFASLDGIRIHYKSLGQGREGLVFVHGWGCDLDFWRFQVPAFAKKTRLLLIDLPGFGESDRPRVAYTMNLFARSVDAMLKDAGVDRVVLVGHSMGTPVVRQFYRLFPAKTLALVAVDGSLRKFFGGPEETEKFLAPFRSPEYREAVAKFVDGMFPNPGTERLRDRAKAVILATPQEVLVRSFEGMFDPSIWKDDPIGVPLLAVNAESPFWGPDYETFVRSLDPDLEYRTLEKTGHFVMLEAPGRFNAILAEFLKRRRLLQGEPKSGALEREEQPDHAARAG
jgi:pimeloyl-ACP methyl ester carboxylesterase